MNLFPTTLGTDVPSSFETGGRVDMSARIVAPALSLGPATFRITVLSRSGHDFTSFRSFWLFSFVDG